ncbi:hypothetical protein BSNK01_18840 [Bacillaceae bacterium]
MHIGSLRRVPGPPLILVPDGLDKLLRKKGYRNVSALSWWEEFRLSHTAFAVVPAQH